MMRITQPLAESLYEAYVELFTALDAGIDETRLAELRNRYQGLCDEVDENESEQERLHHYRDHAHNTYNEEGHLEIDAASVVSASQGGAYVGAWLWVSDAEIPETGD